MNRRQFLFLSETGDGGASLSCGQLYMRYRELTGVAAHPAKHSTDGAEWWAGEPESVLIRETPDAFFQSLGESLRGRQRLELTDSEWLGDGDSDLRQYVDRLLDEFRRAGGQVICKDKAAAAEAMT